MNIYENDGINVSRKNNVMDGGLFRVLLMLLSLWFASVHWRWVFFLSFFHTKKTHFNVTNFVVFRTDGVRVHSDTDMCNCYVCACVHSNYINSGHALWFVTTNCAYKWIDERIFKWLLFSLSSVRTHFHSSPYG